jgi:hypothetical protein
MPAWEVRQLSCHIVRRNNAHFMGFAVLLGFIVFAVALFGLAAVIAEVFVKSPDAMLEIARDTEAFARPKLAGPAPLEPANDRAAPRLAA